MPSSSGTKSPRSATARESAAWLTIAVLTLSSLALAIVTGASGAAARDESATAAATAAEPGVPREPTGGEDAAAITADDGPPPPVKPDLFVDPLAHAPGSASADDGFAAAAEPPTEPVGCSAELRSWVVAFRGRHMYLLIDCPEPLAHLSGRVEYTTAAMRFDYRAGWDSGEMPLVARMNPGRVLQPFPNSPAPDNRLEASYEITAEQARCLQRDRLYSAPYVLVGSNSSSGLRAAMEACGLDVPERVLAGRGTFGEFPGIDFPAGDEVPAERWAEFGLPDGPTPIGEPRPRWRRSAPEDGPDADTDAAAAGESPPAANATPAEEPAPARSSGG